MTSKTSQYTVELSHNQVSFIHAILLQYQQVWKTDSQQLPAHVDDLLSTTLHQLVSCRKQTSQLD